MVKFYNIAFEKAKILRIIRFYVIELNIDNNGVACGKNVRVDSTRQRQT